jgi:tetratricopeptide (TPR) repeat protein
MQTRFYVRSWLLFVLMLTQGELLQAQEPVSNAHAADHQPGLQEQFNTASAAWEKDDCAAALPIFAQLAQDPHFKPGTLPAAAIGLRRGLCLLQTGHADEGEPMVAAALPRIRTEGQAFDAEVAMAEYQLGAQAMARWDHDTALAHFRAALTRQQGVERLKTLSRIAQLTAFDGDRVGMDATDEALRILQPEGATPSRAGLAQWHTLHARILLNQGDIKGGRAEMKLALSLSGGEKDSINLAEALMRADVAQAAMLDHDQDDAYKYMALSGSGRIEGSPFARARVMDPPACGPDTGLSPQDSAVVEFSIDENGQVHSAQPIYSASGYAQASAFARAVFTWAWAPQDAAKIPAFFRAASRVELRCSNADGDGAGGGASPLTPLRARFMSWARGAMAPYLPAAALVGGDDAKGPAWPMLVTAAQAAQDRKDNAGELAARTWLAQIDLRPPSQVLASIERAQSLTAEPGVPPEPRNGALVLLRAAVLDARWSNPVTAAASLLALTNDPAVAQDALAQDTALLLWTGQGSTRQKGEAAMQPLQRVANDSRLGDHHPLRQFAQLRLATEAARKGDLAQAQSLFQATGLNAEQCALIGPRPAMASQGNKTFPDDAQRWGFEGWVRTEFDIQADGHTSDVRAVVAYPPFIFASAAQRILKSSRYQSSYRPEGGAACSANNENVNFRILNNPGTVHLKTKKST